jgi:hypothetical protein
MEYHSELSSLKITNSQKIEIKRSRPLVERVD